MVSSPFEMVTVWPGSSPDTSPETTYWSQHFGDLSKLNNGRKNITESAFDLHVQDVYIKSGSRSVCDGTGLPSGIGYHDNWVWLVEAQDFTKVEIVVLPAGKIYWNAVGFNGQISSREPVHNGRWISPTKFNQSWTKNELLVKCKLFDWKLCNGGWSNI